METLLARLGPTWSEEVAILDGKDDDDEVEVAVTSVPFELHLGLNVRGGGKKSGSCTTVVVCRTYHTVKAWTSAGSKMTGKSPETSASLSLTMQGRNDAFFLHLAASLLLFFSLGDKEEGRRFHVKVASGRRERRDEAGSKEVRWFLLPASSFFPPFPIPERQKIRQQSQTPQQ